MQLHGSTEANLISAVRSAGRLRGQRVHSDTVKYWSSLLLHARRELSTTAALPAVSLGRLIAELEVEIVQHSRP